MKFGVMDSICMGMLFLFGYYGYLYAQHVNYSEQQRYRLPVREEVR